MAAVTAAPAQAATAQAATCTVTAQASGGSASCTVGQGSYTAAKGGIYTITAAGGAGGNGGGGNGGGVGGKGGTGAVLTFTLKLNAGDTLVVNVGGKGADNGGAGGAGGGGKGGPKPGFTGYGGGGGGGFTSVKLNGTTLAVAGGGGGGGGQGQIDSGWFGSCSGNAGNGGQGGAAGVPIAGSPGTAGAQGGSAGGNASMFGRPSNDGVAGQDGAKTARGCGGGSGGGGGGATLAGKAGVQSPENKSAGGGGAGTTRLSQQRVVPRTPVSVKSGNAGAGKVDFTWVDSLGIVTNSLPDAVAGDPYSAQLDVANPSGAFTWSVKAGALPAGLTLSPSGLISGTPTQTRPGVNVSRFTLEVKDDGGNVSTRDFSIDEYGDPNAPNAPKGPQVVSAPATQISRDSATGQGTVFTKGPKTAMWCQVADSEGAVDSAPRVPGNPSQVPDGSATQKDFTCDFKNLEPNTPYFFRTYAEDSQGRATSRTPQTFITDGLIEQTAAFATPSSIAATGTTVVLPGPVKTNQGKSVTVSMQRLGNTAASAARLIQDNATGQFAVVTDGEPFRIRLIWFAAGKGDYAPLEIELEYSSSGSLVGLNGQPGATVKRKDLGKGRWKAVKKANPFCASPTGGATVQFTSTKVKRELVHEDAFVFDNAGHAKQAFKVLSECATSNGGKRVGGPDYASQSKAWNGRDPGHRWRATVIRKDLAVAIVVVGFKGKKNWDPQYAATVTKKAAKRL